MCFVWVCWDLRSNRTATLLRFRGDVALRCGVPATQQQRSVRLWRLWRRCDAAHVDSSGCTCRRATGCSCTTVMPKMYWHCATYPQCLTLHNLIQGDQVRDARRRRVLSLPTLSMTASNTNHRAQQLKHLLVRLAKSFPDTVPAAHLPVADDPSIK